MDRKELFISYRREPETLQFVSRLIHDLEQSGFSVWLDTRDIQPGGDWHGAIGIGLTKCRAIIPVMTKDYLNSRHCVNELYTADGDRKHIFPIFLEDIDLNATEAGQGIKYVVSSVNWTMCRQGVDDYNMSISKLVNAMKLKGLGADGTETAAGENASATIQPSTMTTPTPVIGPITTMPFKVIRDVESPDGITTSKQGHLIVSSMSGQKVLIFNPKHEKVSEIGGEVGLGMGHFISPSGVAVDKDGNLFVVSHYFIQKFNIDGDFLGQAGGTDPKGFQIDAPRGIAIDKNGRIYIVEQKKNRIMVINSDLSFCKTFTDGDPLLGSGHLNMPQSIAINSSGSVYVADMMNNSIQVFDENGNFQFRFGKMGTGPGSTTAPSAVAIDSKDNAYVASVATVSIFDSKGSFLHSFGEYGNEVGKFSQIRALHIDQDGVLYIGEWVSNRIQLFNTLQEDVNTREELKRVPMPNHRCNERSVMTSHTVQDSPKKDEITFTNVTSTPSNQKGYVRTINEITDVRSISISRNGHVVISSGSEGKLSTYDKAYELISDKVVPGLNMCVTTINQDDILLAASVCKICKFDMQLNEIMSIKTNDIKGWTNPYGIALGIKGRLYAAAVDKSIILNDDLTYYKIFAEKCKPFSIAVNSSGLVYLPDIAVHAIHVFSSEGEPLFTFGGPGRPPVPQFSLLGPLSIAIDQDDNIYVGVAMKSLNIFSQEGKFLSVLTSSGNKPGQLDDTPTALCIDQSHRILLFAEKNASRVQVFKLR